MSVSLYEGRRYDANRFVRFMATVNLAFAACILFSWPFVGPLVANPISAASQAALDPTTAAGIADYPYVLLWLMPVLGAVASWLAAGSGQGVLAKFLAAYPLLLILCSCLWYWYLAGSYA